MADDSGNSGGSGGGSPSPAPVSLEDHNARIIRWPHAKKRPKRRTGNRLLDLIHD